MQLKEFKSKYIPLNDISYDKRLIGKINYTQNIKWFKSLLNNELMETLV